MPENPQKPSKELHEPHNRTCVQPDLQLRQPGPALQLLHHLRAVTYHHLHRAERLLPVLDDITAFRIRVRQRARQRETPGRVRRVRHGEELPRSRAATRSVAAAVTNAAGLEEAKLISGKQRGERDVVRGEGLEGGKTDEAAGVDGLEGHVGVEEDAAERHAEG